MGLSPSRVSVKTLVGGIELYALLEVPSRTSNRLSGQADIGVGGPGILDLILRTSRDTATQT